MARFNKLLFTLFVAVLVIFASSFLPSSTTNRVVFSSAGSDMAMFNFTCYKSDGTFCIFSLIGNYEDTVYCQFDTPFSISPDLTVPPGYIVEYFKQSIDTITKVNVYECMVGTVGINHSASGVMRVVGDE